MTIREFYGKLNEMYPRTLSCPWDNDGVMFSTDMEREVRRVLVALDATYGVINFAAENGFDTVLTHHPMIFRGVKSITSDSVSGRRILVAVSGGITVISLHTRLDAGDGGVNDALCDRLGMTAADKFGDDESSELGRTADVGKMTVRELAALVKDRLSCDSVRVTGDLDAEISRVALCGGDGKSLVPYAVKKGCGAYITGDAGYNMAEDAAEEGLATIEVGHYHSESPVCEVLAKYAREIAGAEAEIFDSCAYTVI